MTDRGVDGASASTAPAVRFDGITKRFGALVACDAVDLSLHRGEIHGVLGENGAGKSTLMKILIGLVTPDAGTVYLDGSPARIASPLDAAALGVAMVHQHFSLVEALTVWENVALADRGRLDPRRARRQVSEVGDRYGLDVDPDARVADLSAGVRQRVELVKCLRGSPSILVLDEPTSVLTPQESQQLFATLRRAVEEDGTAVALVSHKLDEVLHATDRVTILRRGRVVARMATADADVTVLARAMMGRDMTPVAGPPDVSAVVDAPVVLRIRDAVVTGRTGRRLLDGLSLEVRRGEIVGVAGVEGNGQVALVELMSSLATLQSGSVEVDGREVATGRAGALGAAGVGVIPEDRHDSGCVLEMSVAENLVMSDPGTVAARGLIDRRVLHARARSLVEEYGITCGGVDAPLWSLSGGNQQRVVVARELSQQPRALVAAQPTRGLDLGATTDIRARLRAAADDGVAVLLVSSEIDEVLELADRLVVLHEGRVVGQMERSRFDIERLGLLMGGEDAA